MILSWKSNKCCSTDFVAFGFLLLIYMNPIDCRKILIWLSWDQIERTDDLRAAWDTCLKSLLLHVTGETAALWCFSWIQFIALCQTSNHHFRYWGEKIKNYLTIFLRLSLSLTPLLSAFVVSVSLAFTKSCIQLLSFPLVRWQVTQEVGLICTLPFWCSSFLSGCPLVLWSGQCHYSWWHCPFRDVSVPAWFSCGTQLFQRCTCSGRA